jgi:SAM-dependent methyltransferase
MRAARPLRYVMRAIAGSQNPPVPYLEENLAYWSRGYDAENVDHPVFRFYGRILKHDGPTSGRLLDFGCGQGSAVAFFHAKGYDAYGVDVSDVDLVAARDRFPALADRFERINPKPSRDDRWFGGDFDVITAIQSLYYLGEHDLHERLRSLHAQLRTGGVFYATMIGTASWYYELSEPAEQGMRRVTLRGRLSGSQVCLFTGSEEQLMERFSMFEPLHVGFYSERFRSDEGPGFHYAFVGRRRPLSP